MTPHPTVIPFKIRIPQELKEAIALLNKIGGNCRLVGGCVRDALLGNEPSDFDVEVYGLEIETIVEALRKTGRTDLVGKSFAVIKLWTQGAEYDFTVPRTECKSGTGHRGFEVQADPNLEPEVALKRRDFTINAIQYDPNKGVVIDYFGGREDLEKGVLRHIGKAFSEDPLRALRAIQFAGRFGLSLDPITAQLCRDMKREYSSLAIERVWGEWCKWSTKSIFPSKGLIALKDSGWISFFPEINSLVRLPQDPEWHPEGDVFTHTLHCLDAVVDSLEWQNYNDHQRSVLIFSVLCHDLGKARCTRFAEKRGKLRWISPGHDQESGWLSESFLNRIGTPLGIQEKVRKLVENHHYLNSFPDSKPSDKSLRRLSRHINPSTTEELRQVMLADHRGRPPLISEAQEKRLAEFKVRIAELELKDSAPKALLLGRHLIEHGRKPGPEFKPILDRAYEAQLDGAFEDVGGALDWLRSQSLL
jgi:tRNA nucleotidyltransferase (CCA-adding enzyme)